MYLHKLGTQQSVRHIGAQCMKIWYIKYEKYENTHVLYFTSDFFPHNLN
jgi:hypothetical protein